MKAITRAALCAVLPAAMALAACSGPKPAATGSAPVGQKTDDVFTYLLDRDATFVEQKVDTLPPLPRSENLLPFDVSRQSPLTYAIDAPSVSIGTDHVIRYTVVATSPSGARNVRYEGIRCDGYVWRLYAAANEDGDGWNRNATTDWSRIVRSDLNAYHAVLYHQYLCRDKGAVGSAKDIVHSLRYQRVPEILNH